MKILVTGGAGYVGSACLRRLLREGVDAHAFDNLHMGHKAAVPEGRLIQGDIQDAGALDNALRHTRADAVMHFAASAYVGESVTDPEKYYLNNVAGTLSLLSAMRRAGVHRLLFSSTCATYGNARTVPMNEETPLDPASPYARTKLAVEWMIRDFARAYGLGFTLLRYFNAAGAEPDASHGEHHDPETHLIPLVLQVALGQRSHIDIFGNDYPTPDGTCIRDYVHICDLADAHWLAINATTPSTAQIFNLGTGGGSSVLEVIRACEHAAGTPIRTRIMPRREGDPPALVADASRIRSVLGWTPHHADLASIVRTAWDWHRSHPRGYT